MSYYQQYLAKWPTLCAALEAPHHHLAGYIFGKVEGKDTNWHGHVTAVTVSPTYRRLGVAGILMQQLENVSQNIFDGYFVDLFVRAKNSVAINFYKKLGYIIYRQVIKYYGDEEDAYDMRKALVRDRDKKSMVPLGRPVYPHEVDP